MHAPGAAEWEGAPIRDWKQRWGVPGLLILDTATSTNDVARELADAGAPAGTLVLADHQTAGKGRMGRGWLDSTGSSLLFSLVLRPRARPDASPGTLPLRVGMAVAGALRSTRAAVMVKWPNDLVSADRKLGGILCEASSSDEAVTVIAGIGINVTQRPADFPAEIRAGATSLLEAAGAAAARGELMTTIIDALCPLFTAPLERLDETELAAFAQLDALRGRRVLLTGGDVAEGNARGIAADGALLVEAGEHLHRITSATVRLAEPHPSILHRS